MLITNPRRKEQIKEFVDKDHRVMTEFYDITDSKISNQKLMAEMKRLIKEDEDFYDPYLTVADILLWAGKNKESNVMLKDAYERAVKRIADYQGHWPEEMAWGWLENRHLMRAIERYGFLCWELGETDEALNIFRRLLRANPGDNQGARYNILALRIGLNATDWQEPFEIKEANMVGYLDASKIDDWFKKNANKFPEEFEWLTKMEEAEE